MYNKNDYFISFHKLSFFVTAGKAIKKGRVVRTQTIKELLFFPEKN